MKSTRIAFLKSLLAVLGVLPALRLHGRQKIAVCPREKMIGLRVRYEQFPNLNYEIVSQCPTCFQWRGQWVDNSRNNKFIGKHLDNGSETLLIFSHSRNGKFDSFDVSLNGMKAYL